MSQTEDLTPGSAAALFGAMVVLSAFPSVSVFTVVARSASLGFRHGVATAAGIVAGDLVLMLVTTLGLAVITKTIGAAFVVITYAGAAYLAWTGLQMWRAPAAPAGLAAARGGSLGASLLTGLAITLGDQKAILLYLAFLPAFLDLRSISPSAIAVVVAITLIAVGGTKCVYAALAHRVSRILNPAASRGIQRGAAIALWVAALIVVLRS